MAELTTTVTADQLAKLVGGKADDPEVQRCLDTAVELLQAQLDNAFRAPGPKTSDQLVFGVARALWDQRKTTTSGGQLAVDGQQLPRAPRDPLATVWPVLARFVSPV